MADLPVVVHVPVSETTV